MYRIYRPKMGCIRSCIANSRYLKRYISTLIRSANVYRLSGINHFIISARIYHYWVGYTIPLDFYADFD